MNNTHTMNNPSSTAALANLEAQPLGRAHLVSLHALAARTPDEDMRELARKRYHTLTADQQRRHAAYVLTYPAVHPVDHLQMVIVGGRPVEVVNILGVPHMVTE